MEIGSQNATKVGIIEYLTKAYLNVSKEQAEALVVKYDEEVMRSINNLSFNYYIGDKIAETEQLEANEAYDDLR